ncbi:uncharacterized protein LOC121737017 isoform X2 [Aricia agestis]|uniref:uncharacterized protein LOC121737017 isoform X2 n=1 Tax=Aricia agestis TaxID=91739 RepID=UPI001C2048F3|nr:uncharacterized protein LOC121737017 isoform X2 [Aricia agestis]
MDPLNDSTASRKSSKCDGDPEKPVKGGKTAKRTDDDRDENVFTCMSQDTNPCLLSMNGPQGKLHATNQSHKITTNHTNQHNNVTLETSNRNVEQSVATSSKCEVNNREKVTESNYDKQACQRHKVCLDSSGNTYNADGPSTSGSSRPWCNIPDSSVKENRKRPSTLKLNRSNVDDDSSSDTGNDDYSLGSEDGCIYTYKGGEHLADLPSSFFSLDMGLPLDKHLPVPLNYPVQQQQQNARDNSRASSPDMDFLEMDFDPGPSCEVDTGDESTPDVDMDPANLPEENEPVIRGTSPEYVPVATHALPCTSKQSEAESHDFCVPSSSKYEDMGHGDHPTITRCETYGPYITHINVRGEHILVRRTMTHWVSSTPAAMHISSGDLISPREILSYDEDHSKAAHAYQINQGEKPTFDSVNLSSTLFHMTMAKKLMVENAKPESESEVPTESDGAGRSNITCVEPPRCMVWSEREACERQVTQIGTSACGATAVVNVFIALGIPWNVDRINAAVGTRQRANNAPIPRYLLSRAVAGCTAADLVSGIHKASDGLVTARFFPTYPERVVSLSHWLADWISLGAVPILTLNLQMGCEGEIPDAWHHQMVWGVSPRGIYLSNPVECVSETALWPRLAAPSTLLVRTRDVLSRFTPGTDLTPLAAVPDRRFHTYNVLGQVVNAIREWRSTGSMETVTRTHLRIPAAYRAGVTLAALTGSEAHRRLVHAPHLPALAPHDEGRSTLEDNFKDKI